MNWIDITILILLAVTTIKGLFDGFIKQVSSLLAVVLAIVFSGILSHPFVSLVFRGFPDISPVIASVLGYIIAFLIIFVTVNIFGAVIRKICHVAFLKPIDTLLGGIFAAVICLFVVSVLLNTIDWIDSQSTHLLPQKTKEGSFLYKPIKSILPMLYQFDWRVPDVKGAVKEVLVYGK